MGEDTKELFKRLMQSYIDKDTYDFWKTDKWLDIWDDEPEHKPEEHFDDEDFEI